jgi:hypothetical protein
MVNSHRRKSSKTLIGFRHNNIRLPFVWSLQMCLQTIHDKATTQNSAFSSMSMLDGLGGRVTAKLGFQIFRHTCGKKMHCERKAWSITAGSKCSKQERRDLLTWWKETRKTNRQKEIGKNPCGYSKASLQWNPNRLIPPKENDNRKRKEVSTTTTMTTVDKNAKKDVITGKENELKMELTKS